MNNDSSEQALDDSMRLFWQRGYFNTSIDALVKVSRFNRATIYQRYGGKQGFFIAMLERYWAQRSQHAFNILSKDEAGLTAIRQFLDSFIEKSERGMLKHGCFYIATASELPSHQQQIQQRIHQFIASLRDLFYLALERSKRKGVLKMGVDSNACADFLVANIFGLLSLSRAEHQTSRVKGQISMLQDFLSTLCVNDSMNNNR